MTSIRITITRKKDDDDVSAGVPVNYFRYIDEDARASEGGITQCTLGGMFPGCRPHSVPHEFDVQHQSACAPQSHGVLDSSCLVPYVSVS